MARTLLYSPACFHIVPHRMATSLDVLNRCGLTKAVADITKNAKLQAKVLEMLALSGVEADGCSPAV